LRGLKVRISRRGTKAFYLFYKIGNARKKYRVGPIDIGIETATIRTIPINNPLARVLAEWRCDRDWLFPGTGINNHVVSIARAWRIIKKEAGLINLRLYDLRHSFASELVQKGVPLYTVSKLLGHSSVQMTPIYAHLDNGS